MASLTNASARTAVPSRPGVWGRTRAAGVTPRALLLGIAFTILVDLWIHWAELVMGGGQGHSALANTSIPVGAFSILFLLSGVSLLLRALAPGLALAPGEMLVIYVMMTTSTVLSSSGQLHFVIPTVAAAWHYATVENGWAGIFHRFVPDWMAQKNPEVLRGFYEGKTAVPVALWLPQMAAWLGFMLTLAFATLCIAAILRRQWVERERLAFPTVALPLALLEPGTPVFRSGLFWLGFALPFGVSGLNTIALNAPAVPLANLRANLDLQTFLTQPPWNAIGYTPLSFYPFVIGIAYFIPVDVTFSCWFFFLLTRAERIVGSAAGIDAGTTGANRATFPFLGEQGAGAFLALTLVSLWLARGYLKDVFARAFGEPSSLDDADEPLSYRTAVIGLLVCGAILVGFCVVAGMQPFVALLLVLLALCYMIAATRIRAETGNAWLYGPELDVNALMTRTLGTGFMTPADLTILAYLRPALANFDLRCMAMPHQLDAFKMSEQVGAYAGDGRPRRALVFAIVLATLVGVTVSFLIALAIWHGFGAEAKTDAWRTSQGRVPFDNLVSLLRNPAAPDVRGMAAVAFGFVVTATLMIVRTRVVWWPLHPVGYAIANTNTMTATWLPFFLAWLFKVLALRYGGARFYRLSLPFFLGLIAGDLVAGGFFTAFGAFTGFNVYPMNW